MTKVVVRHVMSRLSSDPALPGWVRVGVAAWSSADTYGRAVFGPGELMTLTGLTQRGVSESLATARQRGWIGHGSNARVVWLPGHEPEENR